MSGSSNQQDVQIAIIMTKIANIESAVIHIQEQLDNRYVTQQEFIPIQRIVYGLVGLTLTAVLIGLISILIKR